MVKETKRKVKSWEEIFMDILEDPTVKSIKVTSWVDYSNDELQDIRPIFKIEKFERDDKN